jgi:membrane protein required for beta-lactamase induction
MELVKKYWWLILVGPVLYIAYILFKASNEAKNDSLAKARQAKAEYALAKTLKDEPDAGADQKPND